MQESRCWRQKGCAGSRIGRWMRAQGFPSAPRRTTSAVATTSWARSSTGSGSVSRPTRPFRRHGRSARPTALFADYTRDIVRRLTDEREVTLALFTLRLEGARSPSIAAALGAWMRAGFAADVAFNRAAGLPGDEFEIALFHYAIEGLILDRLTVSIDPGRPTDDVVDALVAGLLGEPERS